MTGIAIPMKHFRDDKWELLPGSMEILDDNKLGSGAFATVHKGILNCDALPIAARGRLNMSHDRHPDFNGYIVAVKRLVPHSSAERMLVYAIFSILIFTLCASYWFRNDFRNEMALMKNIGYHEHLVNLLGCGTRSPCMIVVEFCANGDLLNFLHKNKFQDV